MTRFILGVLGVLAVQSIFSPAFAAPYTPSQVDPVEEPWRWRAFPETRGIGVRCIAEGKDGAIWVGTDTGVRRYNGGAWRVYTQKDGPGAGPVRRIRVAPDSCVYVTTQEGVWRFYRWEWTRQQEEVSTGDLHQDQGAPRLQTRDGTVWAGGEGCLTTLQGGTKKVHLLSRVPLFGPILTLIEARDGSLYLAGREEGLFRLDRTEARYRTCEGLRAACSSSDGSLWFLAQDGAVVRQEGAGWTRYGVGEGMMDSPAQVVEGPDGVWVCGSHRGVAATGRWTGDRWEIQRHPGLAADEDRVKQVLTNLIDNALKFTPEGGRVEVEVKRVKSRVRVCVSDTGPGIPRAHQKAIFKKFHQVRKEGGTGLGLPISRKLVQMHGGKMWVESKVGEGSRFFFTLMG